MDEETNKAMPLMDWVRGKISGAIIAGGIGNLLPRELYNAYRFFTGYGTSVARPLYLILSFMITYFSLIVIYATVFNGWNEWVGWRYIDWELTTKLLKRSIANAFPFLGLHSESVTAIFGATPKTVWTLIFSIVGGLQKFFSLVGWFLIGLALRNQFKMK